MDNDLHARIDAMIALEKRIAAVQKMAKRNRMFSVSGNGPPNGDRTIVEFLQGRLDDLADAVCNQIQNEVGT